MTNTDKLYLVVQSPADIKHDLWRNKNAIIWSLLTVLIYIFLSAAIMLWLDSNAVEANYGSSLYFTIINTTTVGFGDLHPSNSSGRTIAIANAIVGLVFFGILVATTTLALQPNSSTIVASSPKPSSSADSSESTRYESRSESTKNTLSVIGQAIQRIANDLGKENETCFNDIGHLHISINLDSHGEKVVFIDVRKH